MVVVRQNDVSCSHYCVSGTALREHGAGANPSPLLVTGYSAGVATAIIVYPAPIL